MQCAMPQSTPQQIETIKEIEAVSHNLQSTLQTSLTLQKPTNARNLLNNITNLQTTLANLEGQFLAALETDGHGGLLGRVARELRHFDVDVVGTTH